MLNPIGPGIWTLDFPFKVGGLALGTRTTIVRMPEGLWVHSPGPITDGNADEINKLGAVRALVSPNAMHYLFLKDAMKRWGEAKVYITPSLQRKTSMPHDVLLGEAPPAEWGGVLQSVPVQGVKKLGETVFLHPESKTLILTDLAFHVNRSDSGFTRFFMKLNGAYGHFGPSRILRYILTEDPAALRESIARILEWDFQQIVVGHGDLVDTNGRARIEEAFAYLH